MLGIYLIGDSEKRVADQDAILRIRNSPGAIGYLTEATGFFIGSLSIGSIWFPCLIGSISEFYLASLLPRSVVLDHGIANGQPLTHGNNDSLASNVDRS